MFAGVDEMEQDIKIPLLRDFKFIHSIILFGSRARGTEGEGSDIDLCIIPKPGIEVSLKDRIALENSVPEDVDISLFDDLPINIRNSVLREGKVLHTDELYYVLTLAKENDLEYAGYKHRRGIYHDYCHGTCKGTSWWLIWTLNEYVKNSRVCLAGFDNSLSESFVQ